MHLTLMHFTSECFPEMLKCEVYKMFSDVELELQPNAWIATFNIKSMLLIFNLGKSNFHSLCKKKKNWLWWDFIQIKFVLIAILLNYK